MMEKTHFWKIMTSDYHAVWYIFFFIYKWEQQSLIWIAYLEWIILSPRTAVQCSRCWRVEQNLTWLIHESDWKDEASRAPISSAPVLLKSMAAASWDATRRAGAKDGRGGWGLKHQNGGRVHKLNGLLPLKLRDHCVSGNWDPMLVFVPGVHWGFGGCERAVGFTHLQAERRRLTKQDLTDGGKAGLGGSNLTEYLKQRRSS